MNFRIKSSILAITTLVLPLTIPVVAFFSTDILPTFAQTETSQNRKAEADRLLQQGIQQFQEDRYQVAVQSFQQALELYRKVRDRNGEAMTLVNLGIAYDSHSYWDKAIEVYQKALSIFRELGDQSKEVKTLLSLGIDCDLSSQYQKSVEFYQQALAIFRDIGNYTGEANTLMGLGIVYRSLSLYSKAIEVYQQALDIFHNLGDRAGEAKTLNNLGNAYFFLSEFDKAIRLYQQALDINLSLGDRHGEGIVRGSLGNAYIALSKYEKAVEFYQQALSIFEETRDDNSRAVVQMNLGITYRHLSLYLKAIELHQQALDIFRVKGEPVMEARALNNLGITYHHLSQYEKMLEVYQKSLAIFQEAGDLNEVAKVFNNLGNAYSSLSQELAIVFYKQCVNVHESIRKDVRKLPREEQQSYTQSVADTYRNLASLLLQKGRVMEALQVLDLLKVQELQDFFKDVKGSERTAQGIEMFNQEQQILKPLTTTPSLNLDEYLKSPTITTLVQQLRQTAKDQNLKMVAYTDLQTRLQNLGTNSALLYPLILNDRIELVLFTRNAPPIHRTTNIKQAELEQTIQSFLKAIQRRDSQDIKQPANQLYNWLIKPIAYDLQQAKIQTLIYAPDGQMRYVPLAALYDGQHWLVENYQIDYLTALSLTKLDQLSSQPPRILAGAFTDKEANITINGQHLSFSAIPFASSEVEGLAQQFPGTEKLTGNDFRKATMTSDRMNGYGIVHLATHGKLVSGSPEDSFILLNNNEYIPLRELKDWKLPNVALVVLSACQTALGDKVLGSGIEIIGFGYQLQQAQARASIATLWEISDVGTSNLMNEFYHQLQKQHLAPVEALRQAQIAMIQGQRQSRGTSSPRSSTLYQPPGQNQTATIPRNLSHPYYWAPFILIGNGL